MPDFALFWKNFADDQRRVPGVTVRRYTGDASLVRRVRPGDRVWFYTSGKACDAGPAHLGYAVQVGTVAAAGPNPGGAADYDPADFPFVVDCDPARTVLIRPPLLVDAVLAPGPNPDRLPIGTRRQKAHRLKDEVLADLLELLYEERLDLLERLAAWEAAGR